MEQLNVGRSVELYREAVQLIPGASQTNSKRPTAAVPLSALGTFPIYAHHAQGSHIWDVDGNEYIDYMMALGPIVLGYHYEAVDQAIRDQLQRGIIYGLLDPLEVEVARALVGAVPCAEMVRFLKAGAEATSAAARIARAYTGREKIVSCGYHGWHDNWTAKRNDGGVPEVLEDYTLSFEYNDLDSLRSVLERHRGDIAGIIITPAGPEKPNSRFLEEVRELAHEHGALLIFDEIVTGFRLARGGAQGYFNVIPDLACFAKGMANGMPLAAVVGRREIMELAEKLIITTTYGGEALSLAAAKASLREYEKEEVYAHIWRRGSDLKEGLNRAGQRVGLNVHCTGLAPMFAIALEADEKRSAETMWTLFLQETAKRGVLFRRGGYAVLTSYSHTEEDIAKTIDVCEEVFAKMKE